MGLDWLVEPKISAENAAEHKRVTAMLSAAHNERQRLSSRHYAEGGTQHSWEGTPEQKVTHATVEEFENKLAALQVSPMETLGAPMVGRDQAADDWIRANYKDVQRPATGKPRLTPDEVLESLKGRYVPEPELLPEETKKGLGSVTGIMAGPESFRGKMLSYVEWLPQGLKTEAYENHNPEQLADYGARLMEVAQASESHIRARGLDPNDDEQIRALETLKSAAQWCLFWGVRGHGMHAWY